MIAQCYDVNAATESKDLENFPIIFVDNNADWHGQTTFGWFEQLPLF